MYCDEIFTKTVFYFSESGFSDSFGLRNRFTSSEPSSSQEFDTIVRYHTDRHEQISESMLTMTRNMKEQSELAGKIIREDTKVSYHRHQEGKGSGGLTPVFLNVP